jgi:hypothetical protein
MQVLQRELSLANLLNLFGLTPLEQYRTHRKKGGGNPRL